VDNQIDTFASQKYTGMTFDDFLEKIAISTVGKKNSGFRLIDAFTLGFPLDFVLFFDGEYLYR